LVIQWLPAHGVPILVVDDTGERRRGKRIQAKGCYRDPVRSTTTHVVKCCGLQWLSLLVLVRLPWGFRPWAWPVLTVLAPSAPANRQAKKRHKTTIDWTAQVVKVGSRWLRRPWVLLGEGAFACMRWAWLWVPLQVTVISRLRLDAQL
jgi:hypothetical protein